MLDVFAMAVVSGYGNLCVKILLSEDLSVVI